MRAFGRAQYVSELLILVLFLGFGLLLAINGMINSRLEGLALGIVAIVIGGLSLAGVRRRYLLMKRADQGDGQATQALTDRERRSLKTIGMINGSLCALLGFLALLAACFADVPTAGERILLIVVGTASFVGCGWWALRFRQP